MNEQLELDVSAPPVVDDDLSWDEWFRSLPRTPGSRATVGDHLDALERETDT